MAINLASLKNELLPGLKAVQGKYDRIPNRWSKYMKKMKSNFTFERVSQMAYLPLAREKQDGASTYFDDRAGERFLYTATALEISLGYIITRRAIEDNQYEAQFNPRNLGLQEVFAATKEIYAANVLNNGTTYDATIGGDGVALFSTAHPVDGGTVANRPSTDQELSETSLLSAMVAIRNNWVDQRNIKIAARPELLVIPSALEPVAARLLMSDLRPGTANNDVNAIRHIMGGLKDYLVVEWLTSNTAWYLKTDKPGLVMYERIPFDMDIFVDFDTDNLKVKGRERYVPTYTDWRCAYGSFPSS